MMNSARHFAFPVSAPMKFKTTLKSAETRVEEEEIEEEELAAKRVFIFSSVALNFDSATF